MQILRSALGYLSAGAFYLVASNSQVIASETGIDSGDTAWILSATVLVLFITLPGLALFYGGLVQTKKHRFGPNASFCHSCLNVYFVGVRWLFACLFRQWGMVW